MAKQTPHPEEEQMIDRQKVEKFLTVLDAMGEESATFSIKQDGRMELSVYPQDYWRDGKHWSDEKRHKMLTLVTPLVGKMEKYLSGRDIGYKGETEDTTIRLAYVDQCKILGYKTVTKKVKREIERPDPVEYEEVEEEERITITDCDLKTGKFSESDIEVPA
jgi:hypothetical protein